MFGVCSALDRDWGSLPCRVEGLHVPAWDCDWPSRSLNSGPGDADLCLERMERGCVRGGGGRDRSESKGILLKHRRRFERRPMV